MGKIEKYSGKVKVGLSSWQKCRLIQYEKMWECRYGYNKTIAKSESGVCLCDENVAPWV